ncbi:MAG: M20/M25/M40 family metallo-hydrolase [Planctomycetota bacterium]|nr:M20/M25/M40 family metallo-hydrolase [Planctomycetota bacterium]
MKTKLLNLKIRWCPRWCLSSTLTLIAAASCVAEGAYAADSAQNRIGDSVRILADDAMEGRGIGTAGIDRAAEYIAEQFQKIGLQSEIIEKGPFQNLPVTTDATRGPAANNQLRLTRQQDGNKAAESIELKLDDAFTPLAAGGSGSFDLPLAFVGYGITDKQMEYDDYAGIDVRGKCVIILRHQPLRGDVHSPFGSDPSRHAYFRTKISNAYAHGAAAILFCTDEYEIAKETAEAESQWRQAVENLVAAHAKHDAEKKDPQAEQEYRSEVDLAARQIEIFSRQWREAKDPLLAFTRAGSGSPDRKIPIFHLRRDAIDPVIAEAIGNQLSELEKAIDETGKPNSHLLPGWRVQGESGVERKVEQIRNVIGVLPGSGPLSEEAIVIGAHYDHLGYGGDSSASPGRQEIHNGADDNASGVAALLEIARRLVAIGRPLPRKIVFIAFTGEERGLLGSAHYLKDPVVPLKDTIAMLNMDMVGRLRDNKLIVHGTGTAEEFDLLIERLNAGHNFKIVKKPGGYGPSDHASFYEKKIPALHFFTGAHQDYHRPEDDFEKINIEGIERVSRMVADAALAIAEADARPAYKKTKRPKVAGGRWPYFGSRPDYGYEKTGVRLSGVAPGGPAERGGLREGDVMLRFGDADIATVTDFAQVLGRYKAGDKVEIVIERDGKTEKVFVILDPPRK